ncbi:MAG: S9 family peptidase [Planctomycetes bacterium]|nr:S9 family peptidase [Planctomycetota bacterium]
MGSPIRPDDIFRLRQPFACRLSPGGDRVLTVVSQPDREQLKNVAHLWVVGVGGNPLPPRQFTHGKHSESNPRWSPDGKSLAFLSGRSGKGEIWTIPADGGEARQLTKLGGSVTDFEWSPNGKKIVASFTPQDADAKEREEKKKKGEPGADSPTVRNISRLFYKLDGAGFLPQGKTHLWLVDAGTGKAKQLTKDDDFSEGNARFSPDGRSIVFLSNRTSDPDRFMDRVDLWRIPARGGRPQKIRKFDGPAHDFSFSPDGRWIAFTGTPEPDAPWNSRHTKLWLIPAAGGRPVELTKGLDRSCENSAINDTFGIPPTPPPSWSPDGRWIAFVVVNEGNAEVWRVSTRDRRPEPLLQNPGVVIDFAVDWDRSRIHSSWADARNPGEIRTDPFPGGEGAPLVHSKFNSGWLKKKNVAEAQEVWSRSRDGHLVQGWILRPPGLRKGRKCPAVLYIHGGPATQYSRVFFHELQLLAAKGYAVLFCNPRASTGYSEAHLAACVGRWGGKDYDDLMAFTDECLRLAPEIDRRRLGVAGGSYGGFMTNWIVGHTPRFSAAVTSRSISNFLSFVGSSDFGYAWPKGFFGHDTAWTDPKKYLAMSPLASLNKMKTPMLIEHQEEDHRCPMEQAEQLWSALKWKGVPVEFARYPQEPHGMSRGGRPDRRIDRLERIVGWFDRWLKNGGRGTGERGNGS